MAPIVQIPWGRRALAMQRIAAGIADNTTPTPNNGVIVVVATHVVARGRTAGLAVYADERGERLTFA